MSGLIDRHEVAARLRQIITSEASDRMPEPVLVEVLDASTQFRHGQVQGRRSTQTIWLRTLLPLDLSAASPTTPLVVWAYPPNPDRPGEMYSIVGYGANANNRIPGLVGSGVVDASGSHTSITRLATVTGIDAKTVGITTLYTVPTGRGLVVDHVVIRVTAFTAGGKSTQAVASFGGNSATYDDYLNSVTYTIAAVDRAIRDSVEDTAYPIYAAAATFRLSVETGSDATTETWAVDLWGYLV